MNLALEGRGVQDDLLRQRSKHVLQRFWLHGTHVFHNSAKQLLYGRFGNLAQLGVDAVLPFRSV